jgi:glutaredoxin-related protein
MDLTFLVDKEKEESFSIEVSFFDSFLEVKEKIYNYQNLPISNQELYFNGKLLKDEDIIMNSELVQDSCIFIKTKLRLQVQFPGYGRYGSLKYFPQVYIDETIMQLKEKIHNKLNFMKINDMLIMFPALKRRGNTFLIVNHWENVEFQTMKLFTCLSRNKNQQRNVARVQRN